MKHTVATISMTLLLIAGCASESNDGSASSGAQPTSDVALPPVGTTYDIGLTTAQWTIPENGAELLQLSGIESGGMIGIESASGDQIVLKLGIADGEGQDYCSRTLEVSGTTVFSDGAFEYGPMVLELSNGTRIEEAHLTGSFAADFSALNDMRFTGRVDLDTFDTALLPEGFEATSEELCNLVEVTAQIACVPCTDGRVRCVEADVSQGVNPRLDDMTFLTVTQANCHSLCAENVDGCTPTE